MGGTQLHVVKQDRENQVGQSTGVSPESFPSVCILGLWLGWFKKPRV